MRYFYSNSTVSQSLSNLSIDMNPTCVHYFNHDQNSNHPSRMQGCIPHDCRMKPPRTYSEFKSLYPKQFIQSYRGLLLRDIERNTLKRKMQKSYVFCSSCCSQLLIQCDF